MKRTPLTRKTPMRRGGSLKRSEGGLKRAGIRSVSKSLKARLVDYRAAKERSDKRCALCGATNNIDAHHPHGRGGGDLMEWFWVCRETHEAIHENPNAAYEIGYLTHKYRGTVERAEPEPWKAGAYRRRCRIVLILLGYNVRYNEE